MHESENWTIVFVYHFLHPTKKKIVCFVSIFLSSKGNKNSRGIRVSSYDPEDPTSQTGAQQCNTGNSGSGGYVAPKTLGNQRKFMPGSQGSSRVSTICQNYNEKTMLLSSDDEYQ